MKKRDDSFFVRHIADAISEIRTYTANLSVAQFKASSLHFNATIRLIEVIGEASKQLSAELKAKHASVPWKAMARMRDRLIHHYFGVDLDVVWLVATQELPAIEAQIKSMLP